MVNRKMKWRSGLIGLLLIVVLLVAMPLTAFADNGDGTGNSQGIMKPLGLTSVTLADGTSVNDAVNIPLKPKFTFHFDKNVVYLLYWERNTKCFHLYDENNKELAMNITKIDDTVDFSKRQYIWVEPVDALTPGTNYRIFVSPDLLAKNGGSTLAMTTNGQGSTIKFKTAGEKQVANSGTAVAAVEDNQDKPVANDSVNKNTAPANAASTTESDSSPKNGVEMNSSLQTSPDSGDRNKDEIKTVAEASTPGDTAQTEKSVTSGQCKVQNYVAAIGIILIVVWLAIEFIKRRNKKK